MGDVPHGGVGICARTPKALLRASFAQVAEIELVGGHSLPVVRIVPSSAPLDSVAERQAPVREACMRSSVGVGRIMQGAKNAGVLARVTGSHSVSQ